MADAHDLSLKREASALSFAKSVTDEVTDQRERDSAMATAARAPPGSTPSRAALLALEKARTIVPERPLLAAKASLSDAQASSR